MATTVRVPVSPDVLIWARKSARMDRSVAASRIGIKEERLRAWEAGDPEDRGPTVNQLRNIASTYHRPLAALFMPSPPEFEETEELPDYRRSQVQDEVNPRTLDNAVMRARRQRDALCEIASELDWSDDETTVSFSFSLGDDPEKVGWELRKIVGLSELPPNILAKPDVLLRTLVRNVELLNVTVIQVQRVDVDVMRGFSFGDGSFPIIALNGADWPRGKIFTLLHELAHVGFRTDGLCDLDPDDDYDIERRCNEVAAAALMPKQAVTSWWQQFGSELTISLARSLGNTFGASGEAAVLRLVSMKLASWDDYNRLRSDFKAVYLAFKSEEKAKSEDKESPIFYQLRARDLGRSFIHNVLRAYSENALSSRDLVQLLGVSYDKVPKLAATAGEGVNGGW